MGGGRKGRKEGERCEESGEVDPVLREELHEGLRELGVDGLDEGRDLHDDEPTKWKSELTLDEAEDTTGRKERPRTFPG